MEQQFARLMVAKMSFIGGRLRPPGDIVTVPLKMNPDGSVVGKGYSDNLVSLDEAQPAIDAPMAPVTGHGDAPSMPQGLPPGAVQIGGQWYTPATFDSGRMTAPAQRHIAASVATDPRGIGATMAAQREQAEANLAAADEAQAKLRAEADADNGVAGGGDGALPGGPVIVDGEVLGATSDTGTVTGPGPSDATIAREAANEQARASPFAALTKADLIEYLEGIGVAVPDNATKPQVVAIADQNLDPADPTKPKAEPNPPEPKP